jgi:CBS domain containing-hemolysin-like protein
MSAETLLLLIAGLALVLLNGFFVAAEFAIVKLRLTQAEDLASRGGIRGRVLKTVRTNLDAYLSACQLGITLASLGLGWIGEPAFARLLEPLLFFAGISDPDIVHGVAFSTAFALISFLHIVLGELAPKSIAIRLTESVSMSTAIPLYLFYWAMCPFIYVLNATSNAIVRWMGVEMTSEGETVHSVQELRAVLRASHRHGELGPMEAHLLSRGLELGEIDVGDLMRPLTELVWIDIDEPMERVLQQIKSTRFTRYPVRDSSADRFVSLLHIKDLVTTDERIGELNDLRRYVRELLRIGEQESLPALLNAFRMGSHLAIVIDEHGHEIGFVTFEHVIEAMIGPVEDEFTKRLDTWRAAPDGSVTGHGSLSLLSLEDALAVPLPEVDANSVGGLVLEQLGRLPAAGERVAVEGFEIEILEMQGTRIGQVRVRPLASTSIEHERTP